MQNKEILQAIFFLCMFKFAIEVSSQKFTVSMQSWLMSHLPIVRHLGVEQLHILSFLYFARSYFEYGEEFYITTKSFICLSDI